jgi:hypothetical protein
MSDNSKLAAGSLVLIALFAITIIIPACAEDPVEPPPSNLPAIPTVGLVAFYPFNGDVLDKSGNDHHASLLGDAEVTTFLTIGNNAVDRLRLPFGVFQGLGDFTFSIWAKVTTLHTTGDHTILSGARSGMDNVLLVLFTVPTDRWLLGVNQGGDHFGPTATMRDLGWHHIVAVSTTPSSATG